MNSIETFKLGIDWGGTKIEIIALDGSGAQILRTRAPTPKDDYQGCLQTVKDLVDGAERELGGKGTVGFGIPGTISPATGLVKNANSTWMNGQPLKEDLEKILEREIRIQNDANCLAVSEAVDGAGAGENVVLAIIIGTGCGSGIAIHGSALTGHQAIAGEFGHVQLPWMTKDEFPGLQCWCGQLGCLEKYVSGTGLENDHKLVNGETLTGHQIMEQVKLGNGEAQATLDRYVSRLARGLAVMVNVIDPDVIVLGGGMSNIDSLYDRLPNQIQNYVFSDTFTTPIRKAVHGDSSGVRGAAWLWNE